MKRRLGSLVLIASFALGGCAVSAEAGPGRGPGRIAGDGLLTLDWTIDGFADPDECDQGDVDTISVLITTPGGGSIGEFFEYCDVFVMSIELAPGRYYGDAVLLDYSDRERTTAVDLGAFDIYGDDELFVSVDFPASSFY